MGPVLLHATRKTWRPCRLPGQEKQRVLKCVLTYLKNTQRFSCHFFVKLQHVEGNKCMEFGTSCQH